MKRRVLFVIDSLACGGAERSLVSLLPLLDFERMDVCLLLMSRGGVFERYVPCEVSIIGLPPLRGWRRLLRPLSQAFFSALLRLFHSRHGAELHWRAMASTLPSLPEDYDVAVAYQQGLPTYYVAKRVSAARKYAWINIDMHAAGYRERFNARFYCSMNRVVAVSEGLCRLLLASHYADPCKLLTIYDIVNPGLIRRMAQAPVHIKHIPEGCLRLVTVARMAAMKNYPLAVATACELRRRGLRFVWHFVGDGPERPHVEALVNQNALPDCVLLEGMQPNPYTYMAAADIYVQTSSFEGFGLTLTEARLLHKPVVSTNFNVVANQLVNGVNGLIAQMDAKDLADKIMLLAADSSLRERLVEATRQEVNDTANTEMKKVNHLLMA